MSTINDTYEIKKLSAEVACPRFTSSDIRDCILTGQ